MKLIRKSEINLLNNYNIKNFLIELRTIQAKVPGGFTGKGLI